MAAMPEDVYPIYSGKWCIFNERGVPRWGEIIGESYDSDLVMIKSMIKLKSAKDHKIILRNIDEVKFYDSSEEAEEAWINLDEKKPS